MALDTAAGQLVDKLILGLVQHVASAELGEVANEPGQDPLLGWRYHAASWLPVIESQVEQGEETAMKRQIAAPLALGQDGGADRHQLDGFGIGRCGRGKHPAGHFQKGEFHPHPRLDLLRRLEAAR